MPQSPIDPTTQILQDLAGRPFPQRLRGYLRLTGPGWLQSAITLGGGSLSSSLYVGVVAGFGLLWVQPVAMIAGIVMLAAIAYVTVTTGQRPLAAINAHVSPVLGWGWALGTLAVSMIWAMPQYTLALGVLQQNLLPGLLGNASPLGSTGAKLLPTLVILGICTAIVWQYGSGSAGVRLFERLLKLMVALIVVSFVAVVLRMAVAPGEFHWGAIMRGLLPDASYVVRPAAALQLLVDATPAAHHDYWSAWIVNRQREVMISAGAYAVGINMTFLFPYSLMRRRWGRPAFGLVRFDLLTGMLIPFALATSCVIIAGASQFHAQAHPALVEESAGQPPPRIAAEYAALLASLPAGAEAATEADRNLAATLVTRDAFDLARSLEPLTGAFFARMVFGLGVIGMTISTIILIMLICGFVVCELLGREHEGLTLRLGSLVAITGALGPFIWSKASFWLAVPASVFGLVLLPVAYVAFLLLMNRPALLGDAMPRGRVRWLSNGLMGLSVGLVSAASLYLLWTKGGYWGLGLALAFVVAVVMTRPKPGRDVGRPSQGAGH